LIVPAVPSNLLRSRARGPYDARPLDAAEAFEPTEEAHDRIAAAAEHPTEAPRVNARSRLRHDGREAEIHCRLARLIAVVGSMMSVTGGI